MPQNEVKKALNPQFYINKWALLNRREQENFLYKGFVNPLSTIE